jgi:long-subunit acyl-CoA synthetase (AMP-forming)/pyrroloquinoline quinone (PQQ) biosynthesis protein C
MNALLEALQAHALRTPDAVAIDPVAGPPLTYAELVRDAAALAKDLSRDLPVDRAVALKIDHGVGEVALEVALMQAGIPALSIPSFFTSEQARYAMDASGAVAAFESGDPRAFRRRDAAAVALPQRTARITFTSGSTGTPKGVCLSAEHMVTVASAVVEAVGAEHAGRHLALLPSGILLETVAGLFPTLLAGGTYVCPPQAALGLGNPFRPDFGTMLRVVAEQEITSLILVPELLAGLVAAMEVSGVRLPLLTLVAVGGARVPPALLHRARALGLPVRQGYGLTEFASVVALEETVTGEPGPVGRLLPHVSARIADDGEVMLSGPKFLGTIGEPAASGEYATGDIGRIDAAGRLWIEGRKSSLIITSHGRNIAPEWVEEALLEQPEIMQAMVHGDGLPLPEALIVPSYAEADVGAAVTRANALLPEYARIADWREVAHFTPQNGRLTGNGRIRRDAIAKAYLGPSTSFYDHLEAATIRERLAFLAVPQVQAGLAGTINLQTYLSYLGQAWHHVRHTVPLMREARARLADRPELIAGLDEYIEEEDGHDEWILSDIAVAGGNADLVRASEPAPATRAMVQHAYDRIRTGNPVSFFGMVYVLESVSVALASRGASAVAENLGLPPQAFTYLTSHGALDLEHLDFFANLVNALEREEDRAAILEMAREMFGLFGAMFAGIDMGTDRVAA